MSDWIGWDGLDGLSHTAVTPRASLQSDANNRKYCDKQGLIKLSASCFAVAGLSTNKIDSMNPLKEAALFHVIN